MRQRYGGGNEGAVRLLGAVLAAAIMAGATGTAAAQRVVKSEPPSGSLKRGSVILVDDGSCPPGQIKEVRAGQGQGSGSAPRQRRCVARR